MSGIDPERLAAVARYAEEAGFESFYLPEHMALHVGARVGHFEIPPARPIADPLECRLEAFARQGVTRLVVGVTATDLEQQRRDLEAFAKRHALV